MNNVSKLASMSALALVLAAPAFAQSGIVGIEDLDDRIEDIEDDVQDDLAEGDDASRYGTNQFAQGWSGSFALGFSATSGNTDTADLDVAGRLRYGSGPWNHSFGFAVEWAEDNNVTNKEEVFATYEANRYLTDSFYIFGLGSANYDNFDTLKWDAFLGAGPGFRVINQENMTWRLQGGPGYRYTEDQFGNDDHEVAGIASSRYFYKFTDTVSLTNDTDVLFSEENTLITNDFGVNFKVTNKLSTRISYRTEWDSDPAPGFDDFDNKFGASLVYGF
ncbi:hypothetical protein FIU86_20285 (plasmid) [Roseovarius sp. THAF9]|uniref:DUF481 domain-containing protein n=1 Tax=Roseovarius sp. THAF9 TaxID=2587847 RepID=UPI001267A2BB|nr:DUF481 domain-containing protein [Roseovarius sp. THAF9]QFT95200.1 hypothetical protein FIU86_20285 [Roseovarius sp. THAF9]